MLFVALVFREDRRSCAFEEVDRALDAIESVLGPDGSSTPRDALPANPRLIRVIVRDPGSCPSQNTFGVRRVSFK